MASRITYEWVIEEVDEHGDIQDVDHRDTADECLRAMQLPLGDGMHYEWGLVRDKWSRDDPNELEHRQWAYVENGILPDTFDEGAKVPAKLLAQFRRATA